MASAAGRPVQDPYGSVCCCQAAHLAAAVGLFDVGGGDLLGLPVRVYHERPSSASADHDPCFSVRVVAYDKVDRKRIDIHSRRW